MKIPPHVIRRPEEQTMMALYCFALKRLVVLHERFTIYDLRFTTFLRNEAVQDTYIASLLRTPPKGVRNCDQNKS